MINKAATFKRASFVGTICRAYKDFSLSFRQQNEKCLTERDLLLLAFTSTIILFMANLPVQLVRGSSVAGVEISLYIGLIGFVSFFFIID